MWRRVTREQLYEQVWSMPMWTLCQQYGLSDNGIRKVCKRLSVPVPPRGYWARIESGTGSPGEVVRSPYWLGAERCTWREFLHALMLAARIARLLDKTVCTRVIAAWAAAAAMSLLAQTVCADPSDCYKIGDSDARYACLAASKNDSSYCYRISQDGARNACLATSKVDDGYCYRLRNKNEQYACLAEVKADRSYCYRIAGDQNAQNDCLGESQADDSYCYRISGDKNRQSACLAETKRDRSYCYRITNDDDLRNDCLANTPR